MKSLYSFILEKRILVSSFFVLLIVTGLYSAIHLPVDAVPDITNVQVMINARTHSLEPDQIEKTVTRIIETEMAGLENLEEIRSISKFGLSQVNLIFKDGTDLTKTRNTVSQRLQKLPSQMPEGVVPEMAPPTTGLGEVFMYVLSKKGNVNNTTDDLIYLRTLQDQIVRPHLKKVKGVAEVDTNGGYPKEIHVNLDPQKMVKLGIRIEQIREQLQSVGENFGGGYLESQKEQIIIKSALEISEMSQLEELPIRLSYAGRTIKLKDIATVTIGKPLRIGAATFEGQEVVLGTALMTVGANSKQVASDLEAAVTRLTLPEDVTLQVVYSRSYLVNATVHTVLKNLIEGALLVIFVLILFLGRWSVAVIVSLAIPISMLIAALIMNPLHITANLMSLGAIDFGLLVDGSVVMIENILRRLRQSTLPLKDTIIASCTEVSKPVIIGISIIVLVYVPILALEGTEGKLFQPMAVTVIAALTASLFIANFLMPILSFYFIKPSLNQEQDTVVFRKISNRYLKLLEMVLKQKWIIPSVVLSAFAISALVFLNLGSEFVPQLNEKDLVIGVIRDSKISLTESIIRQKEVEKIISQFPEVDHVFSRLGTPESATDPMGPNFADTFIILKKDNAQGKSTDDLTQEILAAIRKIDPSVGLSPTQPIEMRFNEMLEGSRADVSVRFYGSDLQELMTAVESAIALMKDLPDIREIQVDELTALRLSPMLNIELDSQKMMESNISLLSANLTMKTLLAGERVGSFQEKLWRYPIYMRLTDRYRNDPSLIKDIPVTTQDGGQVSLSTIAHIHTDNKVTTIARNFGERYGAISLFLKGTDVGGFVTQAKKILAEKLKNQKSFRIEWGGQFKNLERARQRLLVIIPITFLVILFLIYNHFMNIFVTALILSGIPFSISGGLISLGLTGVNMSVSATIGFIALMGISILNCMVLMEFLMESLHEEKNTYKAVVHACLTRLRPVLMTAFVAAFGFLPMVFSSGIGSEIQQPLAIVVVGGILTSTLSTLFVIPYLFIRFERFFREQKN